MFWILGAGVIAVVIVVALVTQGRTAKAKIVIPPPRPGDNV